MRKPLRRLALRRKRRHVSAPALILNPWVGKFRNDPSTSGGRIRTYDLRVMSEFEAEIATPGHTRTYANALFLQRKP